MTVIVLILSVLCVLWSVLSHLMYILKTIIFKHNSETGKCFMFPMYGTGSPGCLGGIYLCIYSLSH